MLTRWQQKMAPYRVVKAKHFQVLSDLRNKAHEVQSYYHSKMSSLNARPQDINSVFCVSALNHTSQKLEQLACRLVDMTHHARLDLVYRIDTITQDSRL